MKPVKNIIIGLGATASVMGGIDASVMTETPIQRVEMVANERVEAKQIGNVVETTLPWKGETGLKVKYDMGEPTANERLNDKREKEVVTEVVDFGEGGFKVDILLNKKPNDNVFCYQIEGYEDYDFFYQPALTPAEQVARGDINRPDFIVGSYAIYHKTLKNNVIGQENYAAGKVMHIPRPQVWEVNDKASTTIWADLSYSNGQLCVTVDSAYLQKATYPVRVDPTFGYTSVGASSNDAPFNTVFIYSPYIYTPTGIEKITSFSIYGSEPAGYAIEMAAYNVDTTFPNTPLDRLGAATPVTLSASLGWATSNATAISMSAGTAYGVAFGFDYPTVYPTLYFDSTGGSPAIADDQVNTFLPTTWVKSGTYTGIYSMYATYEVVSPPQSEVWFK